nr:heavy metal translocating P-type ATPase [Collinsella urealyticum]
MADPLIEQVQVYPRTASLAVCYRSEQAFADRECVLACIAAVDAASIEAARADFSVALAPRTNNLMIDIANLVGGYVARRWFLPAPLGVLFALWNYRAYVAEALRSLVAGRLDVPVLDAAAIGISFIKGDPATAGSTMLLLGLGELLEDYARATSEHELIYSLLDIPDYATRIPVGDPDLRGAAEERVAAKDLVPGDLIVVRTGMPVPVDGVIERGLAMVNQASLTGEPLAVERSVGDDVFAGTAVEDGEAYVRVRSAAADTKVRSIVNLVERSEALKAEALLRRESLADQIVPWNFLLAGVVALTTRSLERTSAALMVDYSCALKLVGGISVLSAMSQSAREGFTVKGSKHFEAMATADTIVFDKTGTLTEATPKVVEVLAFGGWTRTEVLRFAACLEEHFPHPAARAVVNAAARAGLKHRERHAEVEYLVAHGIASSLDGKRAVIGSEHFVIEDEAVVIPQEARTAIARDLHGLSVLYLAVDGELCGAIGIDDPIKAGAAQALRELRDAGIEHIVMLTGDSEQAAARVAAAVGIDDCRADLMPEDKHEIVERLCAAGRRVIMVGDGINDSPALSAAHVGIAMGSGTAIAKEVADITLTGGDLESLVRLRKLSSELTRRMDASFVQVIALNSALLAGGVTGVLSPQASSIIHNGSTVAFSLRNARPYTLRAEA